MLGLGLACDLCSNYFTVLSEETDTSFASLVEGNYYVLQILNKKKDTPTCRCM